MRIKIPNGLRVNVTYHFEEDDLALIKRRIEVNKLSRGDLKRFIEIAVDDKLNEWLEQEGVTNANIER